MKQLSKKQVEFLKKLGFKKESPDESCSWFVKKLYNRFIRKGEITVDENSIIVWGMEPKCIKGHHDSEHMIAGAKYSKRSLKMLMDYFMKK